VATKAIYLALHSGCGEETLARRESHKKSEHISRLDVLPVVSSSYEDEEACSLFGTPAIISKFMLKPTCLWSGVCRATIQLLSDR